MGSDGEVAPAEKVILDAVCKRVGISQGDIKDLVSDIRKAKVNIVVPQDPKERFCQMIDMIFMMMADGKIDQREMDMVIVLGSRLGFNPSSIKDFVDKIVDAINKGNDREQVIKFAENLT